LQDFIENVSVLVDRTPEPAFSAIDRYDKLIEMPDVVLPRRLAV
jgi:hypothetical protein